MGRRGSRKAEIGVVRLRDKERRRWPGHQPKLGEGPGADALSQPPEGTCRALPPSWASGPRNWETMSCCRLSTLLWRPWKMNMLREAASRRRSLAAGRKHTQARGCGGGESPRSGWSPDLGTKLRLCTWSFPAHFSLAVGDVASGPCIRWAGKA